MEANKLMAVCAIAMTVASFGLVGDVCAVWIPVKQVENMPYNGGGSGPPIRTVQADLSNHLAVQDSESYWC
ncbi:hypothetical protein FACS189449_09540 [Alphaproteobacteria bacterium]|nr:hypothetical protein FACS189449_09540 [Alphaproteobacteria bacterium]